jgi:hypothetical protein
VVVVCVWEGRGGGVGGGSGQDCLRKPSLLARAPLPYA